MKPTHTLPRFLQWLDTYVLKQLLVYVMVGILTLISSHKMDGRNYHFDAFENALASFYLATTGMISLDGTSPTNFREPLPIAITALHLKLLTDIPDLKFSGEMLGPIQQGDRISQMEVRYPKEFLATAQQRIQLSHVLIPFVFASMVLVYFLARQLTHSVMLAWLAVIVSWLYFFNSAYFLYRPMTEYFITFFLLLLALCLMALVEAPSRGRALLAGCVFGLAALTKASIFYAAWVVIPGLAWLLYRVHGERLKQALRLGGYIFLGLLMVVSPWILRNALQLGTASLSDRGGQVLLTRAFKNQMTSQEYVGAYFVYAPYELKTNQTFRHWFGFDAPDRDLATEMQRLYRSRPGDAKAAEIGNVDGTISFFHKAVAYSRLQMKLHPEDADKRVKDHAMSLIKSDLPAHLKTMPLYTWRGIWSFGIPDPVQSYCGGMSGVVLNLCCFISFLLFPVYAWLSKKPDLLIFITVPWGLFWFYATFSHFIPRYSAPMIPFAVIAFLLLVQAGYQKAAAQYVRC